MTSRRTVALSFGLLAAIGLSGQPASAQQSLLVDRPGPLFSQGSSGPGWDNAEETVQLDRAVDWRSATAARPSILLPMYVGFVALQAYDCALTMKGTAAGATTREGNPVAARFVDSRVGMIALKGATTAGAVVLSERLWKRHRTAATIAMSAINAGMAAIVARNQRILR